MTGQPITNLLLQFKIVFLIVQNPTQNGIVQQLIQELDRPVHLNVGTDLKLVLRFVMPGQGGGVFQIALESLLDFPAMERLLMFVCRYVGMEG